MTRNKGTNAHLARQKALAGRFLRIKFDLTGESERISSRISFVTEYRHCERSEAISVIPRQEIATALQASQ